MAPKRTNLWSGGPVWVHEWPEVADGLRRRAPRKVAVAAVAARVEAAVEEVAREDLVFRSLTVILQREGENYCGIVLLNL